MYETEPDRPSLWLPPLWVQLLGEPVPWARARRQGSRYFTADAQTRQMNDLRRAFSFACDDPPIEGPVKLSCEFVMPIPASWPKWKRGMAAAGEVHHTAKPDFDNLVKLVKDALSKLAWRDDAQINYMPGSWKRYGDRPRTNLWISELKDPNSVTSSTKRKPPA